MATLEALASQYEKLLIFWEPHRLSRFTYFHKEFAAVLEAFAARHALFSLPLYASGDKPGDYPEAKVLFQHFEKSPYVHIASQSDFSFKALNLDGRKAAAVFMGAGLSSEYAHAFVKFLGNQPISK
jgi:UDP-N-acetylmuramate-alanine ligase